MRLSCSRAPVVRVQGPVTRKRSLATAAAAGGVAAMADLCTAAGGPSSLKPATKCGVCNVVLCKF